MIIRITHRLILVREGQMPCPPGGGITLASLPPEIRRKYASPKPLRRQPYRPLKKRPDKPTGEE
jgi:hypothetical protein